MTTEINVLPDNPDPQVLVFIDSIMNLLHLLGNVPGDEVHEARKTMQGWVKPKVKEVV